MLLPPLPRPQRLVTAEFYRSAAGTEPVRDWLKTLTPDERREIGKDIRKVEHGWPIGMPVCRPLGDGLWEVRSRLPIRIARIFFAFAGSQMILLHGFIKKARVAPADDLALARDRKADLEARLRARARG